MALSKNITSNNGAIATYHRIRMILKDFNIITVLLDSYADSSYRDKEKSYIHTGQNISDKIKELSELTGRDNLTEEETVQRDALQKELDEYNKFSQLGSFRLFQTNIDLTWEDSDNISFGGIYDRIKDTELFNGSVDC